MVSNTAAALSSSTTNDYGSTDTIVENVRVLNDVDDVTKTKTNEKKNDDDDDDENKNEMASLTSSYHTVNDTLYERTSSSYEYSTHGGGSGGDDQETDWSRRRRVAISLSLYTNVVVLLTKVYAYLATSSLSVLAALIDSLLDVVSQVILQVAENHSSMNRRSSALYPAGAARLEPLGVLTCAAVMGVANFEVLRRSVAVLISHRGGGVDDGDDGDDWSSVWGMATIVVVKSLLYVLCRRAMPANAAVPDATLEALAQDHLNDCLSNAVAAVALVCLISSASLWYLDPLGAVAISFYVIAVWYATGREQIEQLTGKAAPADFIDELRDLARDFDERIVEVDVCRAYHFGPKFLVELELVLPRDTLLYESHDLGMELQYEIEGREEVERCFVHIDYETRPYDEHVVSKVPELRERYLENHRRTTGCNHSV